MPLAIFFSWLKVIISVNENTDKLTKKDGNTEKSKSATRKYSWNEAYFKCAEMTKDARSAKVGSFGKSSKLLIRQFSTEQNNKLKAVFICRSKKTSYYPASVLSS